MSLFIYIIFSALISLILASAIAVLNFSVLKRDYPEGIPLKAFQEYHEHLDEHFLKDSAIIMAILIVTRFILISYHSH